MLKIGDFSKLSQVSLKALRFYDEMGLLKPSQIDRFTSYRYYTVDQLPRLNRILALKDLGFSLEQIRQILEQDLAPAELRGMLRLKQAEIQQEMDGERARLVRIEARLRQIEQENPMSKYDVVIKKVSPLTVVSAREIIPQYGEIGRLIGEVFGFLGRKGIQPVGAPFTIWHDHDFKDTEVDAELAVPVNVSAANAVSGNEKVKISQLPAAAMACVIHQGSYDDFGQAYTALGEWIEANGYRICGSNREIYLSGPESSPDPANYVTEIQFPVEKAGTQA
jgi:effector-binding domain-containing protein/DNA-binding transcriptional MerR regulator